MQPRQDEWGTTCFAQREKQRRREREKKRRQRALLALRMRQQPATVTHLPRLYEVFETSSGMRAVTVRMLNSWTTKPGEFPRKVPLSLPYLEFLHGPIVKGAKE